MCIVQCREPRKVTANVFDCKEDNMALPLYRSHFSMMLTIAAEKDESSYPRMVLHPLQGVIQLGLVL